ncbi:diaminopimelate decarboxylase [Brucepastera parasyntrophica]|uniref:diaminopimelate decarboxylase n=1 Tax=Brucepastera parasyntrophica TaxID=2880008 RepID=UPI002108E3BF|nr:diaminopimelate decarboxylase [Brucepastera parasyntrophica]ULQ60529.1 diaminopimelate decarboxylase [Brucepastera parasyntrophica]
MSGKWFPLDKDELAGLAEKYPTPFYLYDEKSIRENVRRFIGAFKDFPSFKEYFAVKACPNPYILKILASEGCGADCSSMPELVLAQRAGITGEDVIFSSNETPENEYVYANLMNAILNLDDISHIDFLEKAIGGIPDLVCFRYNPGPLKEGNAIIGKPEEAKYGLTREQIFEAYAEVKKRGATRFGLHTMVASNELDPDYFIETAVMLFELAAELKKKLGINFEFIDLGGGIGIPYKPDQKAVDYSYIAKGIREAYDRIIVPNGLDPLRLCFECGRPITGPYGWLVTKAIHTKHIYRDYIGVDASMADLMRPGMYGAYHEVTVSGKETAPRDHVYDVVGSLCENCDKFAIQRNLPEIEIGDFVIIHDAGAHGRAMGFNYNAKLRAGELLLREDNTIMEIRRKETINDYFATIDFSGLDGFKV